MTASVLERPKTSRPKREAGGDDGVERDERDRPRIIVDCPKGCDNGKVSSPKTGRPIKCQTCKGEGKVKRSFSRVTSKIDVLDSKDNLIDWGKRMVLIGAAMDPTFLDGVLDLDPEEDKADLARRAEKCADLAGQNDKSEMGTYKHGLTEYVDSGELLPDDATFEDAIDMFAYTEATHPILETVRMEKLVVCDLYRTAGTPDRNYRPKVDLVAPDGSVIGSDQVLTGDTKTGRLDYNAGKISMQLGIYANSEEYDPETGARIPVEGMNKDWGIVMHLPPGAGVCDLYWVDLRQGWLAVELADKVREYRNASKKWLTKWNSPTGNRVSLLKP